MPAGPYVNGCETVLDNLPLSGWRAEMLARCELALARTNPHELAAIARAVEYRVKHDGAPLTQRSFLGELVDADDAAGVRLVNVIEEYHAAACQLRDLLAMPPERLLALPSFGPKSAVELVKLIIRALPEV